MRPIQRQIRDGSWHSLTVRPLSCPSRYSPPTDSTFYITSIIYYLKHHYHTHRSYPFLHHPLGHSDCSSQNSAKTSSPALTIIQILMKAESHKASSIQLPQIAMQSEILEKRSSNSQPPRPRFKHQSFIYKQTMFVYGGSFISSNSDPKQTPLDIHLFNLNKNNFKWEKAKLKCSGKEPQNLSGHCSAVHQHTCYIFGGSNLEHKCNNQLWNLNLTNLEIQLLQGHGAVPSPRESAHLLSLNQHWLMLYGGFNTNDVEVYSSFHLYNIRSKEWSLCQGSSEYQIQARYDPALCYFNDKIYLFGGTYRNIQNEQIYLNDLYEVTITTPSRTFKGPGYVQAKRLQSQLMPQPRSGHRITGAYKQHLLLIGGQNSSTFSKQGFHNDSTNLVDNCWIYNTLTDTWSQIYLQNSTFKLSTQFTLCSIDNRFFAYGGLHSYSEALNDVVELSIEERQLSKIKDDRRTCLTCQLKDKFNIKPIYFPAELIEDIADSIEFPFAAFGLLADNSINNNSTFLHISYKERGHEISPKYIQIIDNAKLPWTTQQLISTMGTFSTQSLQYPAGSDKKTRAAINKQHQRRQFGTNIKVASLRLGNGFLHISHSESGQFLRVFLFRKQIIMEQQTYTLKYYIYDKEAKQLLNKQMHKTRQQIHSMFPQLLKQALSLQQYKNILLILNAKIQNFNDPETFQLKTYEKNNDIIHCSAHNFTLLEEADYNIIDCVDVSLRAYLVSLYIKNENMKISLAIKQIEPSLISTQIYLDRVDKLCKQKCVFEANGMIDYDFKIVELYYLFDTTKKMNFFSNGLLLYHKNRLITRYKYDLGELIERKMYKAQGNYNFIKLFGFIELPDSIPINAFKTIFSYPIMLDKLFARIKFVDKMFKKEVQKLAVEGLKRLAPIKLSQEEIKEDLNDNPELAYKIPEEEPQEPMDVQPSSPKENVQSENHQANLPSEKDEVKIHCQKQEDNAQVDHEDNAEAADKKDSIQAAGQKDNAEAIEQKDNADAVIGGGDAEGESHKANGEDGSHRSKSGEDNGDMREKVPLP